MLRTVVLSLNHNSIQCSDVSMCKKEIVADRRPWKDARDNRTKSKTKAICQNGWIKERMDGRIFIGLSRSSIFSSCFLWIVCAIIFVTHTRTHARPLTLYMCPFVHVVFVSKRVPASLSNWRDAARPRNTVISLSLSSHNQRPRNQKLEIQYFAPLL